MKLQINYYNKRKFSTSVARFLHGGEMTSFLTRINQIKTSELQNSEQSYWQKLLSGFTQPTQLGIKKAFSKDASKDFTFREESIQLAPDLYEEIRNFLQTQKITMRTLLQGVWGFLVSYYSGSDDIIFGSNAFSSKTFPVRVQIKASETIQQYLEQLQKQFHDSCRHAQSSIDQIHHWCELAVDVPLYDHVFAYNSAEKKEQAELVAHADEMGKISIHFIEEYYPLFAIRRILQQLQELIKSFIQNPHQLLDELTLLTAEEKNQVLIDWNQTFSPHQDHKTIQQLFEEQVEKTPDAIALSFEGQLMNYRELNTQANQLAHYLRNLEVKPNSLVAICLEASFESIISILAILKAGAAYLPLDPNYPAERIQSMLEDSQTDILLTNSTQAARFNQIKKIICLDQDKNLFASQPISNLVDVNTSDNLAYVIYTSGSTGKPKGVLITHANVNHFFHWFADSLQVSTTDIIDFSSSISFDFSVPNTLFPLVKGAKIAICSELKKKDPHLYIKHLIDENVTIIKLTPSYFRQLKEFVTPEHELTALRFIVFGGESIYAQDIKKWLIQFPNHRILNEYGPTEATVATSWIIVDKNNINQFENIIPIGKPAFNCQLYILNKKRQPVPIGVTGELYIGGEGVAKGYLNRPEVTATKFIENPFSLNKNERLYKTGDLCRYLSDGNIEFVGRIDHQVKIRGYRVEIGEIETTISSHPMIKEAVVIAVNDQSGLNDEKILIAYYVPKSHQDIPNALDIRKYLHSSLPDYMIPSIFVIIDSIPLSPNGKLDRKALPAPEVTVDQSYKPPRNPVEKAVLDIWSDVLYTSKISIDDNFFELGGHSLSAARIINKIERVFNKEIKLQDFYQAPTISELAIVIEAAPGKMMAQSKQLSHRRRIPLSDMQLMFWLMHLAYSESKGLNIVDRRRVVGKINLAALKVAFTSVFKIHEILRYRVSKILPLQFPIDNYQFDIDVKDIRHLSQQDQENELIHSLQGLESFYAWSKDSPLLMAKLFYLDDETTELQICLSHFISDEISLDILFSDLSNSYLEYFSHKEEVKQEYQYKNYIYYEQQNLNVNLTRDILFWEDYLKNAELIAFSANEIIKKIQSHNTSYTTYLELAEKDLKKLQLFCIRNRISISNSLCAAVGLALLEFVPDNKASINKSLVINFVKSTRDNDIYDHAIGCFLRTDLIKIDFDANSTMVNLSKQIQKSIMETASYQSCSGIVKLACSLKKYWKNKKILNAGLDLGIFLFCKLFSKLKLNHKILAMYGRVFSARIKNQFFASVNVTNNFMATHDKKSKLFDYQVQQLHRHQVDKMVVKNVLEISFDRDNQNKAFLIITANLQPELREQIGKNIISLISQKPSSN